MPESSRRKRGKKNKNANPVDSLILTSHKGAASALQQVVRNDLHLRSPNIGLTQTPPLNYRNDIFWVEDSTDVTVNYTAGGTVFNAQTFQLTDTFTLPSLASLFDQYCIYAVICRFTFEFAVSGAAPGEFLSAIDFDSATVPSGPGALENFSSFEVMSIATGTSQVRMVKPCVTPVVFQSGSVVNSYIVNRSWVDSANTSVPHFGIKYGLRGNLQAVVGRNYMTYVCGFRNKE
jgi:hypothetical protein